MSDDDSSVASSSSSSSSSSADSAILESSAWNRFKENRPIQGQPLFGGDPEDKLDNDTAHDVLLQKRVYSLQPLLAALRVDDKDDDNEDEANPNTTPTTNVPKTSELEQAVVLDCLTHHFLFAHLPKSELKLLLFKFQKLEFHKNEIICREGDPAPFLYVLYRGDLFRFSEQDHGTTNQKEDEEKYTVLGELAFLSGSTYTETVKSKSEPAILFGLTRHDYFQQVAPLQRIQQQQQQSTTTTEATEEETNHMALLKSVLPLELLEYLEDDPTAFTKLASGMTTRYFQKGDVLVRKKDKLQNFVIIAQGQVVASRISSGNREYEDMIIGPGQAQTSFGWHSMMKAAPSSNNNNNNSNNTSGNDNNTSTATDMNDEKKPQKESNNDDDKKDNDENKNGNSEPVATGRIVAKTNGKALIITKEAFANAFLRHHHHDHHHHHHGGAAGDHPSLEQLGDLRFKRMQLRQITVFKDSELDHTQINGLLDLMHHFEFASGESLFQAGTKVEAAMYFVRTGSVTLEMNKGATQQIIEAGGFFGEKNMLLDQNKSGNKHFEFRSPMTAVATISTTRVDVLYLEECRAVVNTTRLGLGALSAAITAVDPSLQWSDITRHALLGSGSFGQVWSASLSSASPAAASGVDTGKEDGPEQTQQQQQPDGPDGVAQDKRRLLALKIQPKHQLLQADKAERIVAERNILASLHSPFVIHLLQAFQDEHHLYMITPLYPGGELEALIPEDGLSERAAKFYAGGILEGLSHLHRHHILHRDVKPGNVLINEKGYPVLIDLGFGTLWLTKWMGAMLFSSFHLAQPIWLCLLPFLTFCLFQPSMSPTKRILFAARPC